MSDMSVVDHHTSVHSPHPHYDTKTHFIWSILVFFKQVLIHIKNPYEYFANLLPPSVRRQLDVGDTTKCGLNTMPSNTRARITNISISFYSSLHVKMWDSSIMVNNKVITARMHMAAQSTPAKNIWFLEQKLNLNFCCNSGKTSAQVHIPGELLCNVNSLILLFIVL